MPSSTAIFALAVVTLALPWLVAPRRISAQASQTQHAPKSAQSSQWTTEAVDSDGEFLGMAADKDNNIHMSFLTNGIVKYAFRPARAPHWYTMEVPGGTTEGYSGTPTALAVDPQGNPHICFTPGVLKYASFDGKQWKVQQIDPGSGLIEFNCSIAIAADGTQHVTWYQYAVPGAAYYLHVKHAVLENGVWLARTIDFEGQTGKWNSVAVDAQGVPHMSYDSFLRGALKSAFFTGKEWKVSVVDSREMEHADAGGTGAYNRGMGNNISISRDGKAQISYEYDDAVLFARETADGWKTEVIDRISLPGGWMNFRTRQALDPDGNPHVVYEDGGSVKHAFWDGQRWKIQIVSGPGVQRSRFPDIAIDHLGSIYIGYRDSSDGSVKVAVSHAQSQHGPQQAQVQNPRPAPKKADK